MTVKNTRPEWQLAAASADATRRQSVISEGLQTQRKIHELVAQHRSKLRSMIGDKQIKAYDAHRKTLNHRLYEARPVGFATERELQRWDELRRQIILESRQFLSEIGIGDETLAAIRKELS